MHEFLWFIGGALLYATLYRILKITKFYMIFAEIHIYLLTMLETTSQYMELASGIKLESLKQTDMPQEYIDEIQHADEKLFSEWKESSVRKMLKCIPPSFRYTVTYESWSEMIKHLDDFTEKVNK